MTQQFEIVEVTSPAECRDLAALLAQIWGLSDPGGVIAPDALRAMAHSGCYVAGVVLHESGAPDGVGQVLIGGSFGWPTHAGGEWRLHSHVAGLIDRFRGTGLGARLKHHQREWVRDRGIRAVEWTYDPLVAANARFNLAKLGARVESFHRDFYGLIGDDFSAGLGSDRFVVRWGVDESPIDGALDDAGSSPFLLRIGDGGEPVVEEPGSAVVRARVPADIVGLRRANRTLAEAWTDAFAATVGRAVADGARVVGISPELDYLIDR